MGICNVDGTVGSKLCSQWTSYSKVNHLNYLGSSNAEEGELYELGFFRQGLHGAVVVENDSLGSFGYDQIPLE